VSGEETIEQAAERALLVELTAREVAAELGVSPETVMLTVQAHAKRMNRPLDDVVRDWFAVLSS
jgi:hypothetical protein